MQFCMVSKINFEFNKLFRFPNLTEKKRKKCLKNKFKMNIIILFFVLIITINFVLSNPCAGQYNGRLCNSFIQSCVCQTEACVKRTCSFHHPLRKGGFGFLY